MEKKRAKRLEEENRIVLSAMEMSRKTLEAERYTNRTMYHV